EPAKGVAEMVRVVRAGGTVAAYMWDMLGGGFPPEPILAEIRAMGVTPAGPPQLAASRMQALRELWIGAGLAAVETREITVERTFADFEDFWTTNLNSPSITTTLKGMAPGDADKLKEQVRARLPADPNGRIIRSGRANAVKGRLPM